MPQEALDGWSQGQISRFPDCQISRLYQKTFLSPNDLSRIHFPKFHLKNVFQTEARLSGIRKNVDVLEVGLESDNRKLDGTGERGNVATHRVPVRKTLTYF